MDRRSRAVSVNNRQEMADDSTPEQSPVLGNTRKRKRQDPVGIQRRHFDINHFENTMHKARMFVGCPCKCNLTKFVWFSLYWCHL